MSNVKISGLTAYTNPAVSDVLPIVDLLNDQTKKITISDLLKSGFGPGTVSLPSFSFIGDPDTGIYSPGANQFAVTTGGTQRLLIDASGNTTIQGDLTVNGTTTTVSSNTLSIKDKNIEIAVVSTPTDTTADGGGITLKGATDKTLTWVDSTDCWTFNQALNLTAGTAGAPALVFNGDVNSGLFQPGADSLAIATAGTQRVTVDSSGRVGIGTSSPQSELTVRGSTPQITLEPTADTQNCRLQFCTTDGTIQTAIQAGGGEGTDIKFVNTTTSSETVRIKGNGNVGIGTSTNLNQKLYIVGTSNDTIDETTGTAKFQGSGGNGLLFGTRSSSPFQSYIQSAFVQDTSVAQYSLLLNPLGGNVGIGTNSPGKLLHLNASNPVLRLSGSTSGNCEIQTDGSSFLINADSGNSAANSNLAFRVDNSERLRIDSSGRVGIGTSSPSELLEITNLGGTAPAALSLYSRDVSISGTQEIGAIYGKGLDSGSSGPYVGGKITFAADGNWDTGTNYYYPTAIKFYTQQANGTDNIAAGPRMVIDSSGKLLLGTTTPGQSAADDLTVASSGSTGITIRSGTTSTSALYMSDGTSGADEYRGFMFYDHNSNFMQFGTNGSNAMRIDSSGNVGIGTSSPSVTNGNGLHIAASNAGLKLQNTVNTGVAYIEYANESNTTTFVQGYRDLTGVYAIRPGASLTATSGLTLDSLGRVGIGNTSPSAPLDVVGNDGIAIQSSSQTNEFLIRPSGSSADGIRFTQAGGAGDRMTIDSSGRVGIGTSSPSSKLQVNGTVTANAFSGDGSALTNLPASGGGVSIGLAIALG